MSGIKDHPPAVKKRHRNRVHNRPIHPAKQAAGRILLLVLGCLFVAVSFNMFFVSNGIASGGVSGVSIIVQRTLGIVPAYTQWALNVPLFFAGLFVFGKRFALQTVLGSLVLPLFVLLTSHWSSPTSNPLLAAIYGGIGVGIGLGLVFRGRGSTGGLDLAAQLLHRYTGLRLGLALPLFDGMVILAAGLIISPENALYALIALFVTSKTIDIMQTGLLVSKVAFIISNKAEEIGESVLHDLDRGMTRLIAQGGYTGEDRPIVMVVVSQNEVPRLKSLVQAVDPRAFVIISDTAEVLGEGFKRTE
nr:YitT family protein [Paenibacillus roseus]